ncbi:hypothetical protein J7M23_01505, partial [Candidatus Sumerlaeota bacterium]|nr:hypothetical protein [Candidatus Sumerlaeota bacterium]
LSANHQPLVSFFSDVNLYFRNILISEFRPPHPHQDKNYWYNLALESFDYETFAGSGAVCRIDVHCFVAHSDNQSLPR